MDTQKSTQPDRPAEDKAGDSIFQKGSTQVGIMAGIVTMVSQPFAQTKIQTMLGLSQSVPIVVAIMVSALLAAHHVFAVQRARVLEGLLLMPLVGMIVFSSYAGTNQLFASESPPAADLARLNNLEAQLNLQKQLNDQLIKALGIIPAETVQERSQAVPQTHNGVSEVFDKLLGLFIKPAYGQDDRQRRAQDEERRRLEALLRNSRLQQERLENERRRLEASRGTKPHKPPLLKSW